MTTNLRFYLLHNCENWVKVVIRSNRKTLAVLQVQFPFRQFFIFTKSPDEIVVEAVDFVEAIVLTASRNTLVISPYCVISLVKIFIFIEWLYSTPKVYVM